MNINEIDKDLGDQQPFQSADGKDKQHEDPEESNIGADDVPGGDAKVIGTDGSNDEKADNTAEIARQVRENDDAVGEE